LAESEGLLRRRVGDALPRRGVLEFWEAGELLAPSLAHRLGQLRPEVGEEGEGLRRRPFLAHEQHRHLRQQQVGGGHRAHRLGRGEVGQAVAEGAIADLVVVLDEGDEGGGWQRRARLPPRMAAVGHLLPLEGEALGQGAAELLCVAVVVGVVGL
jgi:hypothetical protein